MRKRIVHSIAALFVGAGWVSAQTAGDPSTPAIPVPTLAAPVPLPSSLPTAPSVSLQPPTYPSEDIPLSGLPLSALPEYPSEPAPSRRRLFSPPIQEPLGEETPGPVEEGPEFPLLIQLVERVKVANFQLYNQSERVWLSADYLYYWTKDDQLPSLATRGSAANAIPGALGQAGTRDLFENQSSVAPQSGFRTRIGYWVPSDISRAIEGSYFFLGRSKSSSSVVSDGTTLLARPFFHATTNVENAFVVVNPGSQTGTIVSDFTSRLSGVDAIVRNELWYSEGCRFDWFAGFRHLELIESLNVHSRTDSNLPLAAGTAFRSIRMTDHFGTANYFYGGQLGVDSQVNLGRFVFSMEGRIALGSTHENMNATGRTVFVSAANRTSSAAGGLLVQRSNGGNFSEDEFAVVPEAGFSFGYHIAPGCRLQVGYNVLYWSNVARPGDQVDRVVNPSQLAFPLGSGTATNPARPTHFTSQSDDFWAQGITASILFKF